MASAEGTSHVVGSGRGTPPEKFQIWRLRNAIFPLVMRYVSEKSTSSKCEKAGVFSAYKCLFPSSC